MSNGTEALPRWADPATWLGDPAAGSGGCMANPEGPEGLCCAFHQWNERLMTGPEGVRSQGGLSGDERIATFRESQLIVREQGYDAAASFIAHVMGEAGCEAACRCPAAVRAMEFRELLPAYVRHLAHADPAPHSGPGDERCAHCPPGLPPAHA